MNGADLEVDGFEATEGALDPAQAFVSGDGSQSAISRHIHNLETVLGQKLFQRQGRGVVLTSNGQDYYVAVKSALERLHGAGHGLRTQTRSVTIACTQEISHFLLLPIFSEIKHSMEEGANVRVLNCDYDVLHLLLPAGVDIIFEYTAAPTDPSAAKLLNEEIVPVASPAFVERFERVLAKQPRQWSGVPRLNIAQRDQPWATWATWFRAHDCDAPNASVESFENYEYLLEAAARGDGQLWPSAGMAL